MSGRRVGGRFVTHSEAEIYQRALVAPAVNWKQEWVTPAGLPADSKYKVRKWVKSSTPQEFSDESDQEEVQELYANNSAPTMELPPKPVVAGGAEPPAPAVAEAVAAVEDTETKPEPAALADVDVKPVAAAAEDAEMTDDAAAPASGAPAAEPTDLAPAAPMLPASLVPDAAAATSPAAAAANAGLAPPPSTTATASTAPPPSSPLSPPASSPLSGAPSPFPSSSSATAAAAAPPTAASALDGTHEDPASVAGQAHPLPGVEGEMALKGEDGSDPRSEGARIGMGAGGPMDQDGAEA